MNDYTNNIISINEETYNIINISTPQNQEEVNKVTKAQIVARLQVGAMYSIFVSLATTVASGISLTADMILPSILFGIAAIGSALSSYDLVSTTLKYQQSNLDSLNSNTESDGKTR